MAIHSYASIFSISPSRLGRIGGALLLQLIVAMLTAQDTSLFQRKLFIYNTDTLPYRILLPENYDATKKYPLVFFLHGAGERGSDNNRQLIHGAKLFVNPQNRSRFPAIVVFPQCPANSFWSNVIIANNTDVESRFNFQKDGDPTFAMAMANRLLHSLLENYPVSSKQIYAGGLSMGGMGTFEIVKRNPKLFAAAFPVCGGANPATAQTIKRPHWWIFHGAKDDVVPPALSQTMVTALQAQKARVIFTLYPNANHNSWDSAFAEPEFLPWLFNQRKN